jgi:hypothetical protein
MKVDRYLQYRKEVQTFTFRDEADYYAGKSVILVQIRLDDTLYIQTRSYTRISEIFSRIGGYMQLMNTVFLLISSIINKLNSEIKIINSIFKFNAKENKMILKLQSLKDSNFIMNLKQKKNSSQKKLVLDDIKQSESCNKSKSKINLILKNNEYNNITILNSKNGDNDFIIKMNKSKNIPFEDTKLANNTKSENDNANNFKIIKDNFRKNILDLYDKEINDKDFKDNIPLNIFDQFCFTKNSKKYKYIELYKRGKLFYRKKMDITHVFTLLSIIEDFVIK